MKKLSLLLAVALILGFTFIANDESTARLPTVETESTDFPVNPECWSVTAIKTHVLYRGLKNPIDVCITGVRQRDMIISVNEPHELVQDAGGWSIIPGKGKKVTLKVHEKLTLEGDTRVAATREFRVKSIPDPTPKFGGKTPVDNTIKKEDLAVTAGVMAWVPNFDFDINIKVTGFSMTFIREGQVIQKTSTSNRVTDEMKANIKKVARGQKVYIERIEVLMPDGSVRRLAPFILKIV